MNKSFSFTLVITKEILKNRSRTEVMWIGLHKVGAKYVTENYRINSRFE